jgi:hypothetical protein
MALRVGMNRLVLGGSFIALGILIIVVGLVFPFRFFLEPWTYNDQTVAVDPYGRLRLEQNFFMAGTIKGQVTAVNGSNSTIIFYIEDSSGRTIIGPKNVTREFKFEFQPQQTGLYTFVLDNMEANSQTYYIITWQYYYNLLFTTLGFITFITGIISILTTSSQQAMADQQEQQPMSEPAQPQT